MSIRLHIGCGPVRMAGWCNIDQNESPATDVVMDALQISAKFGENVADCIFACHFLEHLAYEKDVVTFLKVAYHTLAPGGILRLAVPDLEIAARAYVEGRDLRFLYGDHRAYYYKDCAAERMHYFMTAWEHKICYDFSLLSSLLADAGFKNIRKCQPNESEIPGFNHDRMISESLFVETRK